MASTTLYKPSGVKVSVNDNSLAYALSLGWSSTAPDDRTEEQKTASLTGHYAPLTIEKKEAKPKKKNKSKK